MKYILIKLVDCSVIIGEVVEHRSSLIVLDNVMTIIFNTDASKNHASLKLVKYNIFSADTRITFNLSNVISYYEPNEELTKYYVECVDALNKTSYKSNNIDYNEDVMLAMHEKLTNSIKVH